MKKGELTPTKARQILHDRQVRGHPLTDQQRKFFGAVSSGSARKSDSSPGESLNETSTAELTETLADIRRRLEAQPDETSLKTRAAAIAAELERRGSVKKSGIELLAEYFQKAAGPFIGPRGGKWADAKHTIPWEEDVHGVGRARQEGGQISLPGMAAQRSEAAHDAKMQAAHASLKTAREHADKKTSEGYAEAAKHFRAASDTAHAAAQVAPTPEKEAKAKEAAGQLEEIAKKHELVAGQVADSEKRARAATADMGLSVGKHLDISEGGANARSYRVAVVGPAKAGKHYSGEGIMEVPLRKPGGSKTFKGIVFTSGPRKGQWKVEGLVPEYGKFTHKVVSAETPRAAKPPAAKNPPLHKIGDVEIPEPSGAMTSPWHRSFPFAGGPRDPEKVQKYQKAAAKYLVQQDEQGINHEEAAKFHEGYGASVEGAKGDRGQVLPSIKHVSTRKERHAMHRNLADMHRRMASEPAFRAEIYKLAGKKIKKSERSEGMGEHKSGIEALMDFAKGDALPTGAPKFGMGEEQGGPLAAVGKQSGSSTNSAGSPVGAPGSDKGKLSEDDEEEAKQMKPHTKPIETIRRSLPQDQRDLVARENAEVVARLRKGEPDLIVGVGVPSPEIQAEELVQPWLKRGDGGHIEYSNASDLAVERLLSKSGDFYPEGSPTITPTSVMRERVKCAACQGVMVKSLTVCPHCGSGAYQPRGTVLTKSGLETDDSILSPRLRPARGVPDLVLPHGVARDEE